MSDISHYTIPGVTTTTSNEIFSECIISDDSDSVHRFHTTAGGAYYAVGAGGPITGRGADLLLIDDPIKSREDASSAAFRRSLQGVVRIGRVPEVGARGCNRGDSNSLA